MSRFAKKFQLVTRPRHANNRMTSQFIWIIDPDRGRLQRHASTFLSASAAAVRTMPAFIGVLQDDDEMIRCGAAHALGEFGHDAAEAAPALSELLDNAEERVRIAAAEALAAIEPEYLDISEALAGALGDPSVRVRIGAARALWSNDRDAERVLPVLADALDSPDPRGRARAARGLSELGSEGRTAAHAAGLWPKCGQLHEGAAPLDRVPLRELRNPEFDRLTCAGTPG